MINLTEEEKRVLFECLNASVKGPFFPDEEFQTLFGLERAEAENVLKDWPDLNIFADDIAVLAINNALVNLVGYPHHKDDIWDEWISLSKSEVDQLHKKWGSQILTQS